MKFSVTNDVQVPVQTTTHQQQQPRPATTNALQRGTPLPPPNTNNVRRVEQRPAQTATRIPEYRPAGAAPAHPRTYVVKPGETMAEVARRTGVSLPKLQAANPTIEPRRLKPGQTLNIPS